MAFLRRRRPAACCDLVEGISSMAEESIRKELQCTIHPLNSLGDYKYVVVCASYQGKWYAEAEKVLIKIPEN